MVSEAERRPRVLVVDDEEVNRELLDALLTPQGYQLAFAGDGVEALRCVEAEPPDVVLLDIMLPGMDGFAVCRALKADRHTRGIPVVLLTALHGSDDRVTGFDAGADDFISKPFNRYELLARLRSLVRLRRLQAAEWDRFRRSLERYLAPPAVEQVLNEPELTVGGRRQVATVLFGDLRGFTSLTATLEPERVVAVLNAHLGKMAEIVLRYDGMVDKFVGDAIMAVFGPPIPMADDAIRAVLAALEMQTAVAGLQIPGLDGVRLPVGIGINTGEVVAGNIGSDRRLEYTVIGDAVNLAARLEQAAGPGQVVISHHTQELVSHVVQTHDLGTLRVKGREEWVRAYAVLGRR
ncbi:MAG: response regulator [Chloroflexi bacterium]|nr:response regulator [Chloroflexota bacterium]